MNKHNKLQLPIILIISLFFLWGFAFNLNPILITHLKNTYQLTDIQSGLIDRAFFIVYFLIAYPAGVFMKKYGYKGGIVLGLLLFSLGAFLFYPAAGIRNFGLFLVALFVIASGLTFLETAAIPFIHSLGNETTATIRLNFAQSFNGLAATLASLIGGAYILSGKTVSENVKQSMTGIKLDAYLSREASAVQLPYIIIGIIILLVALLTWRTDLPEIVETGHGRHAARNDSIWKEKKFVRGIVAQFLYSGAQVCVGGYFIRYAAYSESMNEKVAAMYLSEALFAFMIGRFVGTFLMRYVSAARLLLLYSLISVTLLSIVVIENSIMGIYALVTLQFFMSIMFPTIFSLSLGGLEVKTKQASSFLMMSMVGGVIVPLVMEMLSDLFNIRLAYMVPILCFMAVGYFAMYVVKNREVDKKLPLIA